jgi:hypothetical protein
MMAPRLTRPFWNWVEREYPLLRRRLERHSEENSACKINDGKINEVALSWLCVMIYTRDEAQNQATLYVGRPDFIRTHLEEIKADLMEQVSRPGASAEIREAAGKISS